MTAALQLPIPTGRITLREVRPSMSIGDSDRVALSDPQLLAAAFRDQFQLADDPQENMCAIYLDSRNRPIAAERVFRGTVERCSVSPRDILRSALICGAVKFALCHNHPSGDPAPSAEDLTFTRRVQQSAALVDLELVDHIVIGALRHVSMRTRGLL